MPKGPSEELDGLAAQLLYEKVIPTLLQPLTVLDPTKPVLVHGDLWHGNCCTDVATGKPIVFDACVFWAHSESVSSRKQDSRGHLILTLQPHPEIWRQMRYRFGKSYIKAYQKYFGVAVPQEDHDDRNALYST